MSTREFALLAFATLALALSPASAASLGPTSDEDPPVTCDPGSFVEKVTCAGDRCDNVSITCQPRTAATGRAVWTPWFSEEGAGRGRCPAKHFIAGLACNKGWCDNVSLYCVEIPSAPSTGACTDTRFTGSGAKATVSVLDNPSLDKAGQKFLASEMKCKGGWCSQVSMCVREQ